MIRNKRILLEQDEDGTPHLMVRSFKVLPMNMIYYSLLQLLSKNFPVTKKTSPADGEDADLFFANSNDGLFAFPPSW